MTRFKLSRRAATALSTTALIALASAPTLAKAQPVVVADIAPVAALSDSLLGAGETVLLIGPGTSPHSAALRPSQARGLQDADLVVGIGPALAPGLWEQIETLAEGVKHLELMEVAGLRELPFPEAGVHDDHGHEDHGHDDHDDHDHEEHADHDHDHDHDEVKADAQDHDHGHEDHAEAEHDHDHGEMKEASHDDHDHDHGHGHEDHAEADHDHGQGEHSDHADHADGHDHDHDHAHIGDIDPHMWLDPENAAVWINTLTAEFSRIDPDNAATYAERATVSKAAIATAAAEVEAMLAPYQGISVINAHDDMRYFTSRFGLNTAGAVIPADGSAPGARSVVELSERLAEGDIGCLLTDPSHPSRLAEQLAADAGIAVAELAPLGAPGQSYPEMLVALGAGLAECLSRSK